MKLVALQTHQRKRRLASGVACAVFWATGVLLLEAVGRYAHSDVGDVLGVSLVFVYLVATWVWHQRAPLQLVGHVTRGGRALLQRFWNAMPEFAVDFRGTPPLPNAVPRVFTRTTGALLILLPLCLAASGVLPGGLRSVLAPLSYSLYSVSLFLLWGVLFVSIVSMLFYYALGTMLDSFPARVGSAARSTRREWWLLGAYVLGMAFCAWLLPGWAPLAILALLYSACICALRLPGNDSFSLLWRTQRDDSPRSLLSHQAALVQLTPFVLFVANLSLLARGEVLFGGASDELASLHTMPLTHWLGLVFCWAAVGAFMVASLQVVRQVRRSRCMGPAGLEPPSVWFENELTSELRATATAELAQLGWRAEFAPSERATGQVLARFEPERRELDPYEELFGKSELVLSPGELAQAEVRARVERRAVQLWRRQLIKGVRRLFKAAGRRRFEHGHGFWLGLQHWFLVGMSRDTEQEEQDWEQRPVLEQIVGEPYHELFPPGARRYFRELTRELGVDLIFIEDGLGLKRLEQSLRVLFEVHDIHGGRMQLEDRHFVGCPGVRAVLHELSGESPFRSETYPEPDYQDIARARILHLFRDRGGEEARDLVPSDFFDLPLPLALG